MKAFMKTGVLSPREVINIVMRGASECKIRALGNTQNVLRILRRYHEACINPRPYRYIEMGLSNELSTTHLGTEFYQYGPGNYKGLEECEDLAVFFSQDMKNELNWNEIWSVDGTFSMVPLPYFQLFTISYISDHHVFPCIFVLMKNKSQELYEKMFKILNELSPLSHPRVIKTDFEQASINAMNITFPDTYISGCMFHLGQALQRKLQNLLLFERYQKEAVIKKFVKGLTALSFVDIDKVEETFDELMDDSDFPRCLLPLYNYFYSYYVRSRFSRFPIRLWHCKSNFEENVPRTNNGIEGWHSIFKKSFGASRYSFGLLIFKLKEEEDGARRKAVEYKYDLGLYRRKKYIDQEKKIENLLISYSGHHYGIDFVKALSDILFY